MCVEKTTLVKGSFFLCLGRIWYTKLVDIMSLLGTHDKKNPLRRKGFKTATFTSVCSFLYILDTSAFYLEVNKSRMYKKRTFYTYALTSK